MAFETYEESADGSVPIELYEFTYNGVVRRYTSRDRDVQITPLTYTAAQLSRSEITDTGDITKCDLTITTLSSFPITQLYSVAPPSTVVNLVVKRVQASDLTDVMVIWTGRVLSASWPNGSGKLFCQSLASRMKQLGLRRLYGKGCPHQVYRQGIGECNVAKASFLEMATLSAVDGISLTSATFAGHPDGWWVGGEIKWEVEPNVYEIRGVKAHTGDTIQVTHAIQGITAGVQVESYPGCDHTPATCRAKFSNIVNYGGFPFFVSKNPYGNASVF